MTIKKRSASKVETISKLGEKTIWAFAKASSSGLSNSDISAATGLEITRINQVYRLGSKNTDEEAANAIHDFVFDGLKISSEEIDQLLQQEINAKKEVEIYARMAEDYKDFLEKRVPERVHRCRMHARAGVILEKYYHAGYTNMYSFQNAVQAVYPKIKDIDLACFYDLLTADIFLLHDVEQALYKLKNVL